MSRSSTHGGMPNFNHCQQNCDCETLFINQPVWIEEPNRLCSVFMKMCFQKYFNENVIFKLIIHWMSWRLFNGYAPSRQKSDFPLHLYALMPFGLAKALYYNHLVWYCGFIPCLWILADWYRPSRHEANVTALMLIFLAFHQRHLCYVHVVFDNG